RGSGPDSPLCQADQLSGKFAPPSKTQAEPAKKPAAGAARKPDGKQAGAAKAQAGTPKDKAAGTPADAARELVGPPAPACQVILSADAAGSRDGIQAKLDGTGAGLALELAADLAPRTPLVLRSARADAQLPDKSTLSARLDLQAVDGRPGRD